MYFVDQYVLSLSTTVLFAGIERTGEIAAQQAQNELDAAAAAASSSSSSSSSKAFPSAVAPPARVRALFETAAAKLLLQLARATAADLIRRWRSVCAVFECFCRSFLACVVGMLGRCFAVSTEDSSLCVCILVFSSCCMCMWCMYMCPLPCLIIMSNMPSRLPPKTPPIEIETPNQQKDEREGCVSLLQRLVLGYQARVRCCNIHSIKKKLRVSWSLLIFEHTQQTILGQISAML